MTVMGTKLNFDEFIDQYRDQINTFLETNLPKSGSDQGLVSAMAYSVNAGGKRLRPLLTLAVLQTFDVAVTPARLQAATALELLHTYSLIHDDLPAMDNDNLRRGKPTNHVKFGAGMATLAGDGLLTLAFEWIASAKLPVIQRMELIQGISHAAGPAGMVAGQAMDIQNTRHKLSNTALKQLHAGKTGALIQYAVTAGGILSGANAAEMAALAAYGAAYGLAFQIYDDLMDVIGDTQAMGKLVHKDAGEQKNTYPGLFGVAGTIEKLQATVVEAQEALKALDSNNRLDASLLVSFLEYFKIKE
ncbi:polyprenyl synthetase family protein [Secundilactobacillus kimchicus]|uniref:polyprenyl synthetase family protein n=1 Tax=Secundilactobacillus kimchicus TaxID=528209 RepID=UPI001C0328A9|nr:polyprenyl synthetase family protein [Secundilactobacillus kimchicus]